MNTKINKQNTLPLLLSSLLLFGCNSADTPFENVVDKLTESTHAIPSSISGDCSNTIDLDVRSTMIKQDRYSLVFPSDLLSSSEMRYCNNHVDNNGAIFEIDYVDPGGSGMDGYVNGVIGGVQQNGSWNPSDTRLTGLPVLLSELDNSMIIQWKTSQDNALDIDDKWMASINVIFDDGVTDTKPAAADRDYDLVIESNSFNFNNDLDDITIGNKRSYLARNSDGSLRTFDIIVEGNTYRYGVRYKFHYNSGDKNNKVHVKYIPIDEANVPPYLNHSLKAFIDNSKAFIQYANMPDAERILANEKVAKPTLYVKSVSAGYEVYKGESTLRNNFFKLLL